MIPLADVITSLQRSQRELPFAIGRAMETLIDEAAEASKAIVGHEHADWPALAASTVSEKERLGYVGRVSATDPLLRTGALRDSIRASVEVAETLYVGTVSSDLPYASVQEMGDARVPPRPFLSPPIITMQPKAEAVFGELAVSLVTPGRIA